MIIATKKYSYIRGEAAVKEYCESKTVGPGSCSIAYFSPYPAICYRS